MGYLHQAALELDYYSICPLVTGAAKEENATPASNTAETAKPVVKAAKSTKPAAKSTKPTAKASKPAAKSTKPTAKASKPIAKTFKTIKTRKALERKAKLSAKKIKSYKEVNISLSTEEKSAKAA